MALTLKAGGEGKELSLDTRARWTVGFGKLMSLMVEARKLDYGLTCE